jgi:hypothetical protein
MLQGSLVVREISSSGPPIDVQINILSFTWHLYVSSGLRTKKGWEILA